MLSEKNQDLKFCNKIVKGRANRTNFLQNTTESTKSLPDNRSLSPSNQVQSTLDLFGDKAERIEEIALSNRILTAKRISPYLAVEPDSFQLTVDVSVPGQWHRHEVERVLELTEDWAWGGVLDLATLSELEYLLDSVARGVT